VLLYLGNPSIFFLYKPYFYSPFIKKEEFISLLSFWY
jgi:hypothetical protein